MPVGMGGFAGLLVMGGPMAVYELDRHPYLRDEIKLIEAALAEGKPVLGVCLGSQLLAASLGARVYPGRKEIGWCRVTLGDSAEGDPLWSGVERAFTAFHWHGDVFDLPGGATLLASSATTTHQAFRHGRSAYGILFHMEVTEEMVRGMVRAFGGDLSDARADGEAILSAVSAAAPAMHRIARGVFDRWAGLVLNPA